MKPGTSLSDENWRALVATQANAILCAVQDLRPEDKGYFINLLKDQYAFLTVEGNEYAYNQQTGLAEGELIRRTVDEYVRKNGKCSAEGDCARELDRARGELMAQLLRATDTNWEERGQSNPTFAHNQAAADHLSDVAGYIGALVDTTYGQVDLLGHKGSATPYSTLFTASEMERNNHAAKGSLIFAMRDLYNAMPAVEGRKYSLWSSVAWKDVFDDPAGMHTLNRGHYLDLLAGAGEEMKMLQIAQRFAEQKMMDPSLSGDEKLNAVLAAHGYEEMIQRLNVQIKQDVALQRFGAWFGNDKVQWGDIDLWFGADKGENLHPGILVARNAYMGNLLDMSFALSMAAVSQGTGKFGKQQSLDEGLDDLARVNGQKLLENKNKPIGLLPPPGKKGVETKTIYVDSEGNASVGKLPPEKGGKTYYVDPEGRVYTEDQIPGPEYNTISTANAAKGQVTAPRDLEEQLLWDSVVNNPAAGKKLDGLNNDPRFKASDGWQKMEVTQKLSDGSKISIHYQYNSVTGKAYDIKITSSQRVPK